MPFLITSDEGQVLYQSQCFNTEGDENVTICTGILEREKTALFLNNDEVFPSLFKSIVCKVIPLH